MKKTIGKKGHPSIGTALRQLLLEGNVGTHEEICQALLKQGFSINQPKISRLLHKLGAVKVVNFQGQHTYRLPHEQDLIHELNPPAKFSAKQWVIDVVNNAALIIIHTTPGAAGLIAREIDRHQLALGILGSIAGDDTIFIAPKDITKTTKIVEDIKNTLEL